MPSYMKLIDDVTEEVMKKAEKELGETPKTRKWALEEIRHLIKNEDGFEPVMEDWFLLMFLRNKKFNVAKAFKTLKNYYKFKSMYSGTITDIRPSQVKRLLEMNTIMVSPLRNTNGEVVVTMIVDGFDLEVATLYEYLSAALSVAEVLMNDPITQICGYSVIYDYKDVPFTKMMRLATPSFVSLCIRSLQDTWPARVNSFHIINQPSYTKILWNLVKIWLSKKLTDRVFIHGEKLEDLYAAIPRDILPKKIGGYLPDKIHEEIYSCLYKDESIMELLTKYTYNGVSYGKTNAVSDE